MKSSGSCALGKVDLPLDLHGMLGNTLGVALALQLLAGLLVRAEIHFFDDEARRGNTRGKGRSEC